MTNILNYVKKNHPNSIAVIEAQTNTSLTYKDLLLKIESVSSSIYKTEGKVLALLYPSNTIDSILIYLSCLNRLVPICLAEPSIENITKLANIYKPGLIFLPIEFNEFNDYKKYCQINNTYNVFLPSNENLLKTDIHKDLSLLLQTSGSTDSPKLVRLTQNNIVSNAESIASYLGLTVNERSIQSLPMQYSYGLSLINSHLISGGSIVLTNNSFMAPEFWSDFDKYKCTSFAGVPFMYETLNRLGFDPDKHPSLKTMTQAGGNLRKDLIQTFFEKTTNAKCKFFIMYGQTEATARISYVPYEKLGEKIGSIGIPIPGGQINLEKVENAENQNEIVYKGPNVMMGYAELLDDLKKGDELNGILYTGDLAEIDEDGYFYIVGRLKRFLKLYGKRVNLNDVELFLEKAYNGISVATSGNDKNLNIYIESKVDIDIPKIRNETAKYLGIPPVTITIKKLDVIPMTKSGKKDYKGLPQ